ncbi:MAG: TRAP transporter large permease, partial [Pseudomonadota bacterium]
LGILIPPSAGFVVYAILTEESIGRLFMAGVLPGLLLTTLFVVAIWLTVLRDPAKAPQTADKVPFKSRVQALGRASWIIGIIVLTIGGIYAGAFSAIEAAGIGAFLALIVTILRRALNWGSIVEVTLGTLSSTGTVFLILFGAFVFKTFIGFTGVTTALTAWVGGLGLSGNEIVIAILLVFIVLGMFLDGFAILVLTVPLVQPILEAAGVDLIWFGVLMVIALEMGLISPPVGINVFVVKGIADGVPLNTIFRGIWPFWFAMLFALALIIVFPGLALLLPDTMFG